MLSVLYLQITEIDSGTLDLRNLEELILTCNYIQEVHSRFLPPGIKVIFILPYLSISTFFANPLIVGP